MSTVVVNKEFIRLYNQVVERVGVKWQDDAKFYPSTIDDLEVCCDFDPHVGMWYGVEPDCSDIFRIMYSDSKLNTLKAVALNKLLRLREHGQKIPKSCNTDPARMDFWWIKPDYREEWNRRITKVKPLPSKFEDSLLQYVESITLDLDVFQSMQEIITENSHD